MPVTSTARTAGPYVGNGLVSGYLFEFKVFQASDVLVVQTDTSAVQSTLVSGTHYTVSLNTDQDVSPGGVVNLTAPLAMSYQMVITSNVPATQPVQLTNQGGFFPKIITDALDRLTILMQQLGLAGVVQALRVPEIGGLSPLPTAMARRNTQLLFDSSGVPVCVAPASGSAADVLLTLADTTLANKGANASGYEPSLPYGATTVGGRLNYYIAPVKAVADGTTDDYVELQARINAMPAGGVLLLQPGKNYRTLTPLAANKAMTILGHGAKLNTGATHATALAITASDVKVYGLEIQGAGNGSYNTNGKLVTITGTDNGAGVAPTFISGVTLQGCKLHDAGRSAVQASFVNKLKVLDNDIYSIGYGGVELLSCTDYQVRGNHIKDVTPGTAGNNYGAYSSRTNTADLVRYPVCKGGSVTHNHFENIDWEGLDCHGGEDLDYSHNRFTNCGDSNAAIAIIHADDAGSTPIAGAKNVRVIGNISTGAQNIAIATSSTGLSTVLHENITIQGNVIENAGRVDVTSQRGAIRIGSTRNWSVQGNTMNFVAPYGVVVNDQYAQGGSIVGNSFRRVVSNSLSTPSAVLIDRGASGTGSIVVSDNVLMVAAAGETFEAVRGVSVAATDGGNIRLGENHFDAAGTKYVISATQLGGRSTPVNNFGDDLIAVVTTDASKAKTITLPVSHSANTLFVPRAQIWRATGNEKATLQVIRVSTTQFTVTAYPPGGSATFPANGNIEFYWSTEGA